MKKIVFFLLISVSSYGQKYVAEAPLSSVDKKGFYEIQLPSRVTALVKDDYRNLRIVDDKNAEISYVKNIDRLEYATYEQKEFVTEIEMTKNCCTTITLFNESKDVIDNFLIEIKNADVTKTAVLRGSDDRKTWYALKEKFDMQFGRTGGKSISEVFDFPLSDYAYYQLTINDSITSPLNIVRAWQVAPDIIRGRYTEIPSVQLVSVDSMKDRATWITLKFDTAQYVNKIELAVEGPRFYRRQAEIFRNTTYVDRKNRKHKSLETVGYFEIISGQSPLAMIAEKEKELLIRVNNENNVPLKFIDVRAFQFKQSIIAWLEPDRKYKIVFGEDLQAPVYDLEYFRDSIPANLKTVDVGKLYDKTELKELGSESKFSNRNIIWIAIVFVIALLGFMSYRMLNEKK